MYLSIRKQLKITLDPTTYPHPLYTLCALSLQNGLAFKVESILWLGLKNIMATNLKICSLNVNGIHCMGKRNLMFTELSKYPNDIMLLQETHSTALDERHYKNKWGPNVYFSHGQSNSKGVITIVPKNFAGSSSLIYADFEGRILIIKITINDEEFIICNIYAPTSGYEVEQIDTLIKLNAEAFDYKKK